MSAMNARELEALLWRINMGETVPALEIAKAIAWVRAYRQRQEKRRFEFKLRKAEEREALR